LVTNLKLITNLKIKKNRSDLNGNSIKAWYIERRD